MPATIPTNLPAESELSDLFNLMPQGVAICTLIFDDSGNTIDFTYDFVNPAFYTLTGLSDVINKKISIVIPNLYEVHPGLFNVYGEVISTGKMAQFETNIRILDIWLSASAFKSQSGKLIVVFENITEIKRTEADLAQRLTSLIHLSSTVREFRKNVQLL